MSGLKVGLTTEAEREGGKKSGPREWRHWR